MNSSASGFSGSFAASQDPEDPDWTLLHPTDPNRFSALLGTIRIKVEGPGRVRCRVQGETRHLNILDSIHGGFALALIDQCLFVGPQALGIRGSLGGQTLDIASQFFGPLRAGAPIDVVVDVLRETGRFVFMRGLIEQASEAAVAFSGTIRKASKR